MKLISSAIIYKCKLPSLANISEVLEKLPFTDLEPTDFGRAGFVEPIQHEGIALSFEGGYAFALRYDEKIIPASTVNSEAKKRAEEIEEQQGYKPGRKQIKELREVVYASMLVRALTRSRILTCYYLTDQQQLIVPTTSQTMADRVTGSLVKAMGALEATTIYVSTAKGSLTTRLGAYLGGDLEAFDGFAVGNKARLVDHEGAKFTFDLKDELSSAAEGLQEAIARGAQVAEVELMTTGLTFRFTADFRFKGIALLDSPADQHDFDDRMDEWKHEASLQTTLLSQAITGMCDLLEYKDEVKA